MKLSKVFKARNGIDYSLSKGVALAGGVAMVCNFVSVTSVDFQGFGIGLGSIIAALAAKYYAEGTGDKDATNK